MPDGRGRKAIDEWQMADDECQVADGKLQVARGELKMGDQQCEVEAGGCDQGQSSEPMTEGSSGPVVGYDSQRVTEDATDDKNGILSHEGAHAAGQPAQGDGVGQCLLDDVTTPQKAPNKANLNRIKALNRKNLSQKRQGRRGGNKAKVPRGRRGESRGRAMADRLGRVAGGRWPVKPKAAHCFVRRSRKGPTTFPGCQKLGSPSATGVGGSLNSGFLYFSLPHARPVPLKRRSSADESCKPGSARKSAVPPRLRHRPAGSGAWRCTLQVSRDPQRIGECRRQASRSPWDPR